MAARKSELIITCNAKGVQNVMRFMEERLKGIKQILQTLNEQGSKTGWTDQMRKDFKELTDEAAGIDTIMKRNEQTMIKYGQVMKDLAGSKMKDLKSALREATQALNKMSEKSPGREKLINDIKRIKDQIAGTSGLTMSFSQAQKQLKNLDNTSMDKLKQGLAAIKTQLDDPNIGNKWRRSLEQMQAQYQAAIAVRQAPITNRPVNTMNAAQLRAEQSAITSAIAATQGVKGYEQKAAAYEQRLKAINTQLKEMAQSEKAADAAAKELQATQEASKVVQQVMQGQKVSLDQLTTAYKTLEAQAGKYAGVNPLKYQQTQQAMKTLEAEIKKVKGELLSEKEIHDRIANSGKYSVQQLQQAYNQLQAKLQTLHTNDIAAIKATQKQMKLLQSDINRATGQVSGFAKAWQTAKQNIMMYVGVFAIVNKIKTTISDLVTKNKELSDSMANIRKVSQWASADVVKLTENLAKIDTRNTITTLQNLAYQGAKLGIGQYGVEGLTGFVKAAEQVQTALGEDLGEEALPALAKLTEVMGLIPKFGVEQAMQKAGSAIYQLGATSTATGKNIVEFSKRLMGLANVSGVTADELLGLGSAADSMALMPEVAATAFNKLFNSIHGNTEGIAKAVGMAKEELEGLLYEGKTMEALVKVFEKMQKMSMKELEGRGVFKELGSDGARLTNVMITMANKVDMLKSHLDVANQSFSEGRAVINEYLIQQETAAAYFERAANIWTKSFVNPEGVDVVKQLAQEWYNVSYEMTHSASTMAGIKNTLGLLAEAAMTLIKILPTLIQLMMFYGIGSVLQGIVVQFNAIYRATTLAGTGVARFNALLKTNAIALAVTAVAMLITKMWELGEASKAAAEAEEKRQKIFTDAAAEALQVYNEQAKALNKYEEALKKSNSSEDERNEIIRQFKQEFGAYLEKLGIEINTYKDLESALHRVNKELKDKAYYETGQKLRESYVGDAKSEQTNALSQFMQAAQKYNIPTTVMEDIMEGKITDPAKAIQTVYNSLYGKQYGTNGKLNWIPGKPYQYWVGDESNVRTTMPTGGATGWVMDKVTGGGATQTKEIYNAVTNLVNATKEVNTRENQVTKFMDQYAENYSPQISVEGAIANLKRLKELNEEKLNEGLNVLRDKWKEMSENDRKTDEGKQIGSAIDQYSKQLRSMRGEGYVAPPTKKEINAAESARLKKLRSDFKQSKEDVDGLIAKVDQWYNLQDATINEFAATGQITNDEAKKALDAMKIARNIALEKARLAVASGDDTDWKKFYTENMQKMMVDHGKWSGDLFKEITEVDIKALHDFLAKFNGSDVMAKLDASSFFDTMRKKAAESKKVVSETQAKAAEELNKMLLKYEYFDKAARQFASNLVQIGALGTTAEQMAQGMEGAPTAEQSIEAVKGMLAAMLRQGTSLYKVNPSDAQGVADMIRSTVSQAMTEADYLAGRKSGEQARWFDLFPEVKDWMNDPEGHKRELENFYKTVIQAERDYYEKRKQSYDFEKREHENRFRAAGYTEQESREQTAISNVGKMKDAGIGASFMEQQGLGSIAQDPEVLSVLNHIKYRQMDVESAEARIKALHDQHQRELADLKAKQEEELALRQAANATMEEMEALRLQHRQQVADMEAEQNLKRMGAEDLLREYQANLFDQETQLVTTVAQEMRKRVQTINTLTKPIQDGAQNVGKKFGEMIRGVEEDSMTWNEIWRSMAQAVGDSIVDMMAQYAQNLIMEKMMNQQSKSEALSKAQVDVAAGTASAAAKTVGQLGWWGLALIPVIAAVLHGLLAAAFASNKQSDTSKSSATKLKLVSGMLTYDEGNVGTYLGQDGRVYRAREDAAPKTGLITKPIATTVQGQPALVAERGPEIVIGRKTTKRIQMAAPELLHAIQLIDRGYTPRRLYDEGNVVAMAQLPAPQQGRGAEGGEGSQDARMADTLAALTQTVAVLSATVTQLQKNGIPAHINKYGSGGLIEEVKSGLRFDARYNK